MNSQCKYDTGDTRSQKEGRKGSLATAKIFEINNKPVGIVGLVDGQIKTGEEMRVNVIYNLCRMKPV